MVHFKIGGRRSLLISLATVLCLQLSRADRIHYHGHHVLRLVPYTSNQVLQLNHILETEYLQLDFWNRPQQNKSTEVHVRPESKLEFTGWLTSHGLAYDVIIDDLESVVEEERRRREDGHRRRRHKRRTTNEFLDELPPSQEVYAWLDEVERRSDLMSQETIGTSVEGREIRIVKLSDGRGRKPYIFMDVGIHSREYMAIGTGLWIIRHLATKYGRDRQVTEMINMFDWYIIPLANPDGYDYTQTTDRFWRKNRRVNPLAYTPECDGVDLNRNFNYPFGGPGSHRNPCSINYRGPSGFSEPETLAIRRFLRAQPTNPVMALSIHAFSQVWLLPWSYTTTKPDDYDEIVRVASIAVEATRAVNGRDYRYGTPKEIFGGLASGSTGDYLKGRHGVTYTYGLELYPDSRDVDRISSGFFTDARQIKKSAKETWAGIYHAARAIRV